MIIDCIADLHGHYPKLDGGDLLIVAGDLTACDKYEQYVDFFYWLMEQDYRKKIFISGNHDNMRMSQLDWFNAEYLCDSGTEFEGLKVWGSPWSLTFPGINPKCTAFTGTEEVLAEKFELIPHDTDILITHGPPKWILDKTVKGERVGSESLFRWLESRGDLKLIVFGHIHESYGKTTYDDADVFNCSHVNERYEPVNAPVRVIL